MLEYILLNFELEENGDFVILYISDSQLMLRETSFWPIKICFLKKFNVLTFIISNFVSRNKIGLNNILPTVYIYLKNKWNPTWDLESLKGYHIYRRFLCCWPYKL